MAVDTSDNANVRRCWCGTILSQSNPGSVCRCHAGVRPPKSKQPKTRPELPQYSPWELESVATQLTNAVGRVYNITPNALMQPSRQVTIEEARKVLAYLIRSVGASLEWTGLFLGQCHSTILYSCRKINDRVNSGDGSLSIRIETVKKIYPRMPGDRLLPFRWPPMLPNKVLLAAARSCNVSPEVMLTKRKKLPVTLARNVAEYLFHAMFGIPPTEIGLFFGQKPRTVFQNYTRVRAAIKDNTAIAEAVQQAQFFCFQNKESDNASASSD
jgi:hypothetical protein